MKRLNINQLNTAQKLTAGVLVTVFFCICLLGTTFTLHPAYAGDMVRAAAPCLNNGEKLFDPAVDDLLLEPGMTIRREFTIQSIAADGEGKDVYYGFYFKELNRYAEILEVSILNEAGETLVPEKTMASMNVWNVTKAH